MHPSREGHGSPAGKMCTPGPQEPRRGTASPPASSAEEELRQVEGDLGTFGADAPERARGARGRRGRRARAHRVSPCVHLTKNNSAYRMTAS
jgi:hypothetical protein